MPRASWNRTVIAEATPDEVEVVENNIYFPPGAVAQEYLRATDTHSVCPWKGTASYYDVVVNGEWNADAAWYYPEPKDAAAESKDYVAFWHGIDVDRGDMP